MMKWCYKRNIEGNHNPKFPCYFLHFCCRTDEPRKRLLETVQTKMQKPRCFPPKVADSVWDFYRFRIREKRVIQSRKINPDEVNDWLLTFKTIGFCLSFLKLISLIVVKRQISISFLLYQWISKFQCSHLIWTFRWTVSKSKSKLDEDWIMIREKMPS